MSTTSGNVRAKIIEEQNEVSYSVIEVSNNLEDVLSKVATAINVRLALDAGQSFPLFESERLRSLVPQDKVFLYGPSGCGKSRTLFEIIRRNIDSFSRIYVVNPRNSAGGEAGRTRIEDLVSRFGEDDAVIWDNFPDDLIKRDLSNARKILEIITSRYVKKLLISLKPKYLEMFKELPSTIPEFFTYYVTYDKEGMKNMIRMYGTGVPKFQDVYTRHVAPDIDRISKVLWQKEPTPLTVLDYYNELLTTAGDDKLDGVNEAETLLRSTIYYEHQFGLLTGMPERKRDVEFLYVLKLCYEIGMERQGPRLAALQKAVFGSDPPDAPYERLSTWVYLSGQQYSMHDVCREAVDFTDYVKIRIMNYLAENMGEIISERDTNFLYTLGIFLGSNVQFMPRDQGGDICPPGVSKYMSGNAVFEWAFGAGVGETFESLDEKLQQLILDRVDIYLQFGAGMAEGFGHIFSTVDMERRKQMLQKTYSGLFFARYLGQSLGRLIKYLPPSLKDDLFSYVEHNPQFADGLGMGIGYVFERLDEQTRSEVFEKARSNLDMTRGLGYGFGLNISSLNGELKKVMEDKSKSYAEFDKGVGMALGTIFVQLGSETQKYTLDRATSSSEFSLGLGIYSAISYREGLPVQIWNKLDNDVEMAHGLGMGYGAYFGYLPKPLQQELMDRAARNNKLELGLGSGLGFIFKHLPKEMKAMLFSMADTRPVLDTGLGFGIGFTWVYQRDDMKREALERAATNNMFAHGLAYGVGYHFTYLDGPTQQEMFNRATGSFEFESGLGYGLGYAFQNLGSSLQRDLLERINSRPWLGYGLGSGIGRVFTYLSKEEQEEVMSLGSKHGQFARGLGLGIGNYSISYADDADSERVFGLAKENSKFALGLGEGLGYCLELLGSDLKKKVFGTADASIEFAMGLGLGIGRTYTYKPGQLRDELDSQARSNAMVALGLGAGLGMVIRYLNSDNRKDAVDRNMAQPAFAKGLGLGLGFIFSSLPESFQEECSGFAQHPQFAVGFGTGLGSAFSYMPTGLLNPIVLRYAAVAGTENGLGEGLGWVFKYLDGPTRASVVEKSRENKNFARGLAKGLAYEYYSLERDLQKEIIDRLRESGFGAGLGDTFGMMFARLDNVLREHLMGEALHETEFSKSFGFSLSLALQTLSDDQVDAVMSHCERSPYLAYSLGYGVGRNFLLFTHAKQEKLLARASGQLGLGLGHGLGKIFDRADSVMALHLLKKATQDSELAYGLGYGMSTSFSSLTKELQYDIAALASKKLRFSEGFGHGLAASITYMGRDAQEALSGFVVRGTPVSANLADPFQYEQYAAADTEQYSSSMWNPEIKEISFSGQRQDCCVGIIDMVGSTKVAATLNEGQLSTYYSTFLNAMATIAENFGARVIKNVGDALIFYFPKTSDPANSSAFRDVIECGLVMTDAYDVINARLMSEKLPSLNYRISADYGKVEVARSKSLQNEDLFGPAMNVTAKINSKALTNGLAIGQTLYDRVKGMEEYSFVKADGTVVGISGNYHAYHVASKGSRNVLNPFKRTSAG